MTSEVEQLHHYRVQCQAIAEKEAKHALVAQGPAKLALVAQGPAKIALVAQGPVRNQSG